MAVSVVGAMKVTGRTKTFGNDRVYYVFSGVVIVISR